MPLALENKEVRVALIEALQRKYPEHSASVEKFGVSFVRLSRDPGFFRPGDDDKDLDVPAFEAYIECAWPT